jgi:hypothetical protein
MKVARDADFVYFYAKTREALTPYTDPNWMMLFINTDQDSSTGWEGYDVVVNRSPASASQTTLEQTSNGWNWSTASSAIAYAASGNEIEIRVPRALIGQGGDNDPVALDFHWADNTQTDDDIIQFSVSGDSAPNRRFDYRYQTGVLADTTLRSNGFETGIPYGDWEISSAEAYSGTYSLVCSEDDNVGIYESLATQDLDSFRVSFKYKLRNVEAADNLYVYYQVPGIGFVQVGDLGADNDVWQQYTDVRYNRGDDAKFFVNGPINFHINGHLMEYSNEFLYIDDLEIIGYSAAEPPPPSPEESYSAWAATYGLDTNSTGAMAFDFEPDGLDNLAEYALGGNPTNHDAASLLPTFGITDAGGGSNFIDYVYNRRRDAALRGLSYGLNESTNLLDNWLYVGTAYETGSANIDPSFESVTNAIPVTEEKGFINLEIWQSF